MKKLLMLGGCEAQVSAIKKVSEMGYYIIICDKNEDAPGKQYAHEYYNISITDKEAVLKLAQSLQIDGIVCYALDSGAPTVAFVAEKLGLPTNPYISVETISNKGLFRAFLEANDFCVPRAKDYQSLDEAKADIHNYKMPIMVKPVDSSGSRGVSKVDSIHDFQEKVINALKFSRVKRFIVEEYIESQGYQIDGDGFIVDGQLVFRCFANGHFSSNDLNPVNPFVPVGHSWPSTLSKSIQNKIHDELQRLIDLLNMEIGAFNFDIQIDEQENVYFIDMGARNGGHLIPHVIKYATGVDMIEYTIKAALGEDCSDLMMAAPQGYWSSYLINSQKDGIFKGIEIEDEFKRDNIVEYDLNAKIGDKISAYIGSNLRLGTMVLKFSSLDEMLEKMDNMTDWVKIISENSLIEK